MKYLNFEHQCKNCGNIVKLPASECNVCGYPVGNSVKPKKKKLPLLIRIISGIMSLIMFSIILFSTDSEGNSLFDFFKEVGTVITESDNNVDVSKIQTHSIGPIFVEHNGDMILDEGDIENEFIVNNVHNIKIYHDKNNKIKTLLHQYSMGENLYEINIKYNEELIDENFVVMESNDNVINFTMENEKQEINIESCFVTDQATVEEFLNGYIYEKIHYDYSANITYKKLLIDQVSSPFDNNVEKIQGEEKEYTLLQIDGTNPKTDKYEIFAVNKLDDGLLYVMIISSDEKSRIDEVAENPMKYFSIVQNVEFIGNLD